VTAFDLPLRSVFEPPSYPNAWFHVHVDLAASQDEAVRFVTGWLRDRSGIVNDFGRFKAPEAADSQARLGRVQPWRDSDDPTLAHAHDLHVRYYWVALRQQGQDRAGDYWRFAASVHYEVEDEHPRHPDIDECPICGRTGEYAGAADLFAGVHEPLGLELLCYGTVRGEPIARADGTPAVGLVVLGQSHGVTIERLSPARPDMNVVALAAVVIRSRAEAVKENVIETSAARQPVGGTGGGAALAPPQPD
jgi:hypothetical protein